ncbi:hypothetical protein NDU88_000182 [Pleurodeles waltl]|uniref:Secreted protein n=1 Tax=Pleurodeles waltl TaxID=8319 RepID=A0AAV7VXN1_PLEWA|nr:hypothetical protein NDU88_000182 [Pleurodeles waltl]
MQLACPALPLCAWVFLTGSRRPHCVSAGSSYSSSPQRGTSSPGGSPQTSVHGRASPHHNRAALQVCSHRLTQARRPWIPTGPARFRLTPPWGAGTELRFCLGPHSRPVLYLAGATGRRSPVWHRISRVGRGALLARVQHDRLLSHAPHCSVFLMVPKYIV